MKKLFVATLMMAAMTTMAQEGKPLQVRQTENQTTEQRVEKQVQKYTAELNLDAKQQERLRGILTDRINKREVEMAEMKLNRDKGIKPAAAARNTAGSSQDDNAKMKELLTPQQYERWNKLKEERATKMRSTQTSDRKQNPATEQ